jgi:hypothetical protein
MKSPLTTKIRLWTLYGALVTAMACYALTLTTESAYAGTCTTTFCQTQAFGECNFLCESLYAIPAMGVICPATPTTWDCICKGNIRRNGIPCP